LKQLDEWMAIDAKDDAARKAKGFDYAYDLRVWESFPGDSVSINGVILQNLTAGYFGCGGGPTESAAHAAAQLVEEIKA